MSAPQIWQYVLGDLADTNSIATDSTQTDVVSLRRLFPSNFSVPIDENGTAVRRRDINALYKAIGENIFFYQRGGVFPWHDSLEYQATSLVTHNGKLFFSLADTSTEPGTAEDWLCLIEVSKADIAEINQTLNEINQRLNEIKIPELSSSLSDSETTAATPKLVKGIYTDLNNQIGSLSDLTGTLSDEVSGFSADLSTLQVSTDDLADRITWLEQLPARVQSLEDADKLKAAEISGIQTSIQDIQSTLDILNTETVMQSLSDMQTEINSYQQQINDISSEQVNLNNRLNTIDGLSDLTDLTNDIVQLKTDMSGIQDTIASFNNDNSSLQSDINALKSRLDTVDSTNSTQNSDIRTLKNDLTELQDDVKELEDYAPLGVYVFNETASYDTGVIVKSGDKFYQALTDLDNIDTKSVTDEAQFSEFVFTDADTLNYLKRLRTIVHADDGVIDSSKGLAFIVNVTAPVTLQVSSIPGDVFSIKIINGGSNVTLPTEFKFPDSQNPPTFTETGIDLITVMYDGEDYLASLSQDYKY